MPVLLKGPEMEALADALGSAYDLARLERMLKYRLDKDIEDFAGPNTDRPSAIFELINVANQEGWWPQLVAAARASNSGNPKLIEVEAKLLAPTVPVVADNLQKIVQLRSLFQDVRDFGKAYGQIETCVCAIEDSLSGIGTGWLVGLDLVLTNFHVVQKFLEGRATPADLRCRFDFKMLDGTLQKGRAVPVAEGDKWCIASRPYSTSDLSATANEWQPHELDYALLRLAEPVGGQPIGGASIQGAPNRGWITVASKPPGAEVGDTLFVFQHPVDDSDPARVRQLPMKLADGKVLCFAGQGIRVRHDVRTLKGSSGSPCCNAQLVPVALHHAGDPRDWPNYHGEWNQAIPLALVVKDLQSRGVEPFWDKPPPAAA